MIKLEHGGGSCSAECGAAAEHQARDFAPDLPETWQRLRAIDSPSAPARNRRVCVCVWISVRSPAFHLYSFLSFVGLLLRRLVGLGVCGFVVSGFVVPGFVVPGFCCCCSPIWGFYYTWSFCFFILVVRWMSLIISQRLCHGGRRLIIRKAKQAATSVVENR